MKILREYAKELVVTGKPKLDSILNSQDIACAKRVLGVFADYPLYSQIKYGFTHKYVPLAFGTSNSGKKKCEYQNAESYFADAGRTAAEILWC